jgi:hypothetical protein
MLIINRYMQHKNYYAFTAKTNYDLGLQMGGTFKNVANNSLKKEGLLIGRVGEVFPRAFCRLL